MHARVYHGTGAAVRRQLAEVAELGGVTFHFFFKKNWGREHVKVLLEKSENVLQKSEAILQ